MKAMKIRKILIGKAEFFYRKTHRKNFYQDALG